MKCGNPASFTDLIIDICYYIFKTDRFVITLEDRSGALFYGKREWSYRLQKRLFFLYSTKKYNCFFDIFLSKNRVGIRDVIFPPSFHHHIRFKHRVLFYWC